MRIHPELSRSYQLNKHHLLSRRPCRLSSLLQENLSRQARPLARGTNSHKIGEKSCRNELRTSASGGLVSSQTQIPRGISNWTLRAPTNPKIIVPLTARWGLRRIEIRASIWKSANPPLARGKDGPSRETLSLEEPGDEMMQLDAAPAEAEEMSLGEPLAKSPPMEILVGSPTETAPEEEEGAEGIFLAPLGRRFLAGLTDALVLILGAAVFGIIFWRFCGRLSLVPLNIAVLGFVAVILIFAYFAVFTAIASATPGLLWMGCEIRNLRGGHPTVRESFWRAFGVLVSLSALMLGFVWACVDSDSLTWHDRMSGTVITEEHSAADLAGLKAET